MSVCCTKLHLENLSIMLYVVVNYSHYCISFIVGIHSLCMHATVGGIWFICIYTHTYVYQCSCFVCMYKELLHSITKGEATQ